MKARSTAEDEGLSERVMDLWSQDAEFFSRGRSPSGPTDEDDDLVELQSVEEIAQAKEVGAMTNTKLDACVLFFFCSR